MMSSFRVRHKVRESHANILDTEGLLLSGSYCFLIPSVN